MISLLFDIGPPGGSIGIAAIVGGFFVLAAIAYVIFRLLRKTVGMAIRLAIVAAILIIGLMAASFFFYLGDGTRGPVRPAPRSTR